MEIVKVLLTTLLWIRGCGPNICNSLKGKLKLENVDSVGENRPNLGRIHSAGDNKLSWGGYTQLGITGSAGEDRLG